MPEEKKIVLNVSIHDDKDKAKAMSVVSAIGGISSIAVDPKDYNKVTVIGDVDPVKITTKLRKKSWEAHLVSVGPAKEPEKKKEEPKKKDPCAELLEAYKNYRPPCAMPPAAHYYVHGAAQDYNPNSCVIC